MRAFGRYVITIDDRAALRRASTRMPKHGAGTEKDYIYC